MALSSRKAGHTTALFGGQTAMIGSGERAGPAQRDGVDAPVSSREPSQPSFVASTAQPCRPAVCDGQAMSVYAVWRTKASIEGAGNQDPKGGHLGRVFLCTAWGALCTLHGACLLCRVVGEGNCRCQHVGAESRAPWQAEQQLTVAFPSLGCLRNLVRCLRNRGGGERIHRSLTMIELHHSSQKGHPPVFV